MNSKALSSLFVILVSLLIIADISAQGAQRLMTTANREMVNFCSSPLSGGGSYLVNVFADPIFNAPDSVGINITRHTVKGDIEWSIDLVSDDASYALSHKSVECVRLEKDTLLVVAVNNETADNAGDKFLIKIDPSGEVIWTQTISDINDGVNNIDYNAIPKVINGTDLGVVNYFATHDNQDTVGIHWEQMDSLNMTLRSRSYYATTLDSLDSLISLKLYDVSVALDSGFVASVAVGDDGFRSGVVDLDSLGMARRAASFMVQDSAVDYLLEFTAITPTLDSSYVAVGYCQHLADQRSVIVKLDSSLNIVWANMLNIAGMHSAGDVLLSQDGQVVVGGKYLDDSSGLSIGNYSLYLNDDGSIEQSVKYENDISLFANNTIGLDPSIEMTNDASDMTILMTTTGVASFVTGHSPLWIKIGEDGEAFCSDTLTAAMDILSLRRDTLGLGATMLAERSELDIRNSDYSGYNMPTLDLADTLYCPQDTIMFELDATVPGATAYVWSTDETTPTIIATEEGQYTVTVTVEDRVCFTMCDTTMISQQGFPVITLSLDEGRYCNERELVYLVGSTTNTAGGVTWLDESGVVVTTEQILVVDVPDNVDRFYSVNIIDNCGNPADTTFQIPDLRPTTIANIAVTADNLCDTGALTLTAQWDNRYETVEYLWNTMEITESIDVLNPGTYTVTLTDECGHMAEGSITLEASNFDLPDPTIDLQVPPVNCDNGAPQINIRAIIGGGLQGITPEILWSDQSTGMTLTVDEPGIYSVTVTICDEVAMESVEITDELDVENPTINIMASELSTTTCGITLTAATTTSDVSQDFTIIWNTNELGENINISEPGTYTATITDMCGQTAEASITISEAQLDFEDPTINITAPAGLSTSTCDLVLQATTTMADGLSSSIVWSTNELGNTITVNSAGTYSAVITDGCGQTSEASFDVSEADLNFPDPTGLITAAGLTDACEQILMVTPSVGADGLEIVQYTWSNGSTEPSTIVSEQGVVTVSLLDNCGNEGSATFNFDGAAQVDVEWPNIFFPNSFNDLEEERSNKTFGPYVECPENVQDYTLAIYNQWGKKVFETTNVEERWSGSLNNSGNRVEEGVYMYYSTYNGTEQKGDVTMVLN